MQPQLIRTEVLTAAGHEAGALFWTIIIGSVLLACFWTLLRWKLARLAARQRRFRIARLQNTQAHRNRQYDEIAWNEFCDHHGLSVSVRTALTALSREQQ